MFPSILFAFLIANFGLFGSTYGQNGSNVFININNCFLLYSRGITLNQQGAVPMLQPLNGAWNFQSVNCNGSSPFSAVLNSGPVGAIQNAAITMNFVYNTDLTWSMINGSISVVCANSSCTPVQNAYFTIPTITSIPLTYSYTCLTPDAVSANLTSLSFKKFQIQAYGIKNGAFGFANDCVGFFTVGTLMSLFVSLTLILILSYGLAMIMTIQTQARVDDPKSKQVQIGSATD